MVTGFHGSKDRKESAEELISMRGGGIQVYANPESKYSKECLRM